MPSTSAALIQHDAGRWIDGIKEVPRVNPREKTPEALLTTLGLVRRAALAFNRDEAREAAPGDFSGEPVPV